MKYKESNSDNNNGGSPMFTKCEQKITENKTWLSLSTYKKAMISNNKICKSILNKILFQMRNELISSYSGTTLQLTSGEGIKMESVLNLLSACLKKMHKTQLNKVITALQTLPEMHSLLQFTQGNHFAHYLPSGNMEYTLVLDLDETLVHFVQGNDDSSNMAQIRPGAKEFIDELSEYFEIVIFTAAKQDYADIVIDGVDTSNKVVIPFVYEDATSFSDGLARVKKDGKYGFIDRSNNIVISLAYEESNSFHDGLARVKKDVKYGFIDKSGKVVIPFIYDELGGFNEGLAKAKINDKWGFIDKTGKRAIPFVYSFAKDFKQGKAYVKINNSGETIDKFGRRIPL